MEGMIRGLELSLAPYFLPFKGELSFQSYFKAKGSGRKGSSLLFAVCR